MLEAGTCRVYQMSRDSNEYKRVMRTLSGENKESNLTPELINDELTTRAIEALSEEKEVILIHDPSDLRKPHAEKMDNLGKVRTLEGDIINGYSTHNIVAITPNGKQIHLLSHKMYSNKDEHFLKAKDVKQIEAGKEIADNTRLPLYQSDDWFNKKTLSKEAITDTNKAFKASCPDIRVTHIFDREFDDDEYFDDINDAGDQFIIRAKKSRSRAENNESPQRNKKEKLIESNFQSSGEKLLQQVRFKKQFYQDAKLQIDWTADGQYTAVRVTALDREGKAIFKQPMLLITNKTVESLEEALLIYCLYLKRSKIETVFKFLKDGLGWDSMQIQDFQAIKTLLACCFFLAAYLYEIGKEKAYDDYAILLAELGGGNGKVTRHYILNGIQALLSKYRIDHILKKRNPSPEMIEGMLNMAGYIGDN